MKKIREDPIPDAVVEVTVRSFRFSNLLPERLSCYVHFDREEEWQEHAETLYKAILDRVKKMPRTMVSGQ